MTRPMLPLPVSKTSTSRDGARLRHVTLQTWRDGTRGFLGFGARVGRDADLLTVFGSFGADRVKVEMSGKYLGYNSW